MSESIYNQVIVDEEKGDLRTLTPEGFIVIGKTTEYVEALKSKCNNLKKERDDYKNILIENGLLEKEYSNEELIIMVKELKSELEKLKKSNKKNKRGKLKKNV